MVGVPFGPLAGGESGHGVGEDVGPGPSQPVHALDRHRQRGGGIKPPGDPDDQLLEARGPEPGGQPLDLDLVYFGASLAAPGGVGGDVGEAGNLPLQRHRGCGRGQRQLHRAQRCHLGQMVPASVVEAGEPEPVGGEAGQVHIGGHQLLLGGEPLRLGQAVAVLVHHRLAVPCQVGRGLTLPGGGVQIGGEAASGLGGAELPAILRLGHQRVGGRNVDEHGGPTESGQAAGGDGHPQVLADLDVEYEALYPCRLE